MCDLISVIVPVYKVEPYLDRCVKSIIKQTYRKIEIILVDDGSPDQCPQMCDEWENRDERIRVLHKKNGGLSSARNEGIAKSKGRYIAFVDSDDCIDERFIECLYLQTVKTGAQISCVDMLRFEEEQQIVSDIAIPEIKVYTKKEAIAALFESVGFQDYACNKMYERELFNTVTFPEGRVMEDLGTTYRLFECCETISFCPQKLYFYYQRDDSIVHNSDAKYVEDRYFLTKERYLYIREKYPNMRINYQYYNGIALMYYPLLDETEALYARQEFKRNKDYGFINPNTKVKIKAKIFMLSGKLYRLVWTLLKRT